MIAHQGRDGITEVSRATGSPHRDPAGGSVALPATVGLDHPGGFGQLLPATIATAAVDRFLNHAHVVVTVGDSYRCAQARDGKG